MSDMPATSAPRWATVLLARLAGPDRADEVVGDLEEAHRKRLARHRRMVAAALTSLEALDVAVAVLRLRLRRRSTASGSTGGASAGRSPRALAGRPPRRLPTASLLDVKLGLRMLIKHPALALIGGLGLAVGMAISIGFYAFSTAYIYPTVPLDEGDRIVALENRDVSIDNEERRSLHDFFTWREELETVQDLTAFRTVTRDLITGEGPPALVPVAEMTAAGFRLARVPPLLGRYLVDDDEREGAPPVVVIGYHVWRNVFGGDPAIIGRTIRLGRVAHAVVGVMPEGFAFPENHRFWTPLRERPSAYERREGPAIYIAGRLAPGVTMAQAQAELTAIGRRTAAAHPETHALLRPMVMPYVHSLIDVQGITVWQVVQTNLLMSLILVVIALNVAVLVYARTAARRAEIAMRSALGASRARIVSQLFAEALVLSVAAAAVGLAIAWIGISLGNRIVEAEWEVGIPFWMDYGLQPGTILITTGVAIFAAVVTGVLPALQSTGRRLQSDLRRLGGNGMRLGRLWTVLIVAQVAIAVAALPAAVSMGWAEIRRALTRATFPVEEFVGASLSPEPAPDAAAEAGADGGGFGDRLTEVLRRLEAEPTVAGATFMATLPGREGTIRVEGRPPPPETPAGHLVVSSGVGPGFVELLGARVLSGRPLEPGDAGVGSTAVIVTQAFVRQVLGGSDALGRRIRHVSEAERTGEDDPGPERWYEIVGVVEDLQTNAAAPEFVRPTVYYPVPPDRAQRVAIIVRLRGTTPAEFAGRIRQIAIDVDPTLRLGAIHAMADNGRQQRAAAQLVGLAVGLVLLSALLLSAAGIYAMMSFAVTQRRREIGIRSALGARPRQVLKSVFARAAAQIALGLAVGVGAAVVIERVTGGGLIGGRGAVLVPLLAGLMAVVGMLAALGPARRGLRIEPTEALRGEG